MDIGAHESMSRIAVIGVRVLKKKRREEGETVQFQRTKWRFFLFRVLEREGTRVPVNYLIASIASSDFARTSSKS